MPCGVRLSDGGSPPCSRLGRAVSVWFVFCGERYGRFFCCSFKASYSAVAIYVSKVETVLFCFRRHTRKGTIIREPLHHHFLFSTPVCFDLTSCLFRRLPSSLRPHDVVLLHVRVQDRVAVIATAPLTTNEVRASKVCTIASSVVGEREFRQ